MQIANIRLTIVPTYVGVVMFLGNTLHEKLLKRGHRRFLYGIVGAKNIRL